MKTASGFEFNIEKERFNDMRIIDAFVALEHNPEDMKALVAMSDLVLGTEGKEQLYAHLALPDGRVPADAFGRELGEIMRAAQGDASTKKS